MRVYLIVITLFLVSFAQTGNLQFSVPKGTHSYEVSFYNLSGREVFHNSGQIGITTNFSTPKELGNQMLVMKLTMNNTTFVRKVTSSTTTSLVIEPEGNILSLPMAEKMNPNDSASLTAAFNSHLTQRASRSLSSPAPTASEISKKTQVIYANGLNTEEYQAIYSARSIEGAYLYKLQSTYPNEVYNFNYVWNETNGFGIDLAEAAIQKANELGWDPVKNKRPFWKEYLKYATYEAMADQGENFTPEELAMACKIGDTLAIIMRKAAMNVSVVNSNLINCVNDAITDKKRVIIIAHSQGNFNANAAYQSLSDSSAKHVGVISLATPSKWTPGWHYTNTLDRVMLSGFSCVKPLVGANNILPGTVNVSKSNDLINRGGFDGRYHSFDDSYFHPDLTSRDSIDSHFFNYCYSLPFWNESDKELFFKMDWYSSAATSDIFVSYDGTSRKIASYTGDACVVDPTPISLGMTKIDNVSFTMTSYWGGHLYGPVSSADPTYFGIESATQTNKKFIFADAVGYDAGYNDGGFTLFYK